MTRNWHDCYRFYCSLNTNKNFAILVSQSVHQRNLMHSIEHHMRAEPGALKDLVIMETGTVFLSLIACNLRRKSRNKDHKWVIESIHTNNYIASSRYWKWCIYLCENVQSLFSWLVALPSQYSLNVTVFSSQSPHYIRFPYQLLFLSTQIIMSSLRVLSFSRNILLLRSTLVGCCSDFR